MDFVELMNSFKFLPNVKESIRLLLSLIVGGGLGFFLRCVYLKVSTSLSSTDLLSRNFPLLIVATVVVIAVVKSSLALSLGLVGALSIVRFRTAIKDPEELVWLFICIATGVALGAGQLLYAIVLVFSVSTLSWVKIVFLNKKINKYNLLVTVAGENQHFFESGNNKVMEVLKSNALTSDIQRYDMDGNGCSIRFVLTDMKTDTIVSALDKIRKDLPGLNISYINMDSTL